MYRIEHVPRFSPFLAAPRGGFASSSATRLSSPKHRNDCIPRSRHGAGAGAGAAGAGAAGAGIRGWTDLHPTGAQGAGIWGMRCAVGYSCVYIERETLR